MHNDKGISVIAYFVYYDVLGHKLQHLSASVVVCVLTLLPNCAVCWHLAALTTNLD